jgi:hypothetical protein
MKTIGSADIRTILTAQWPDLKHIWLFDYLYVAVDEDRFKLILEDVKTIERSFDKNVFDCDDFSHVTSAFIKLAASAIFKHGIAFGEVAVRQMWGGVHCLNVLITPNEKVRLFEPQSREFIDGQVMKPFFVRI